MNNYVTENIDVIWRIIIHSVNQANDIPISLYGFENEALDDVKDTKNDTIEF